MKQSTYVKITGLAEAQKRQYASEAALAGLSLSAYLLRYVEAGRHEQGNVPEFQEQARKK